MKLIDVFPDALTGSGIFDALDNYNVPWKTDISSISLDLEYFGNVSGDKTVSPLIRKLSVNGVLSSSAIAKIAQSLYNMHGLRWTKLWNTYKLEYDPIQNYNMTEIMSDDDTVTTYGRTHSKTGTEVDDRTRTDDNKESVYGFNSSTASDSDESDRTINDDNTHTYNVSDTDTGSDTQSHSYELTRSGNIGVTTSQQMIESERALWMWRYFYDVVFPDVDKMLTISIYSDDIISESGGVAPTGTINITLNGDYDVTEYASAEVEVPNTYTAADDGMVVHNGELVLQIGREISANGTYDTTLNNALSVSVPNTYTAADEGKVVDNGALVAQISQTITENGTYDTTLVSELIANISGGPNILSGTDTPAASAGNNGDLYLRTTPPSIKNTTTQYINTGYTGNSDSKYVIDFMIDSVPTSQYPTPFGARSSASSVTNAAYVNLGFNYQYNVTYIGWGTSQPQAFASGPASLVGKRVQIELEAGSCKMVVDGVESVYTFSPTSISDTTPIGIFAMLIQGAIPNFTTMMNNTHLYSFKIYESDVLVHNFIPAIDNNDVVCLRDTVDESYKYNAGTGTFEYDTGGVVSDAYCKVNGSWQNLIGTDINNVNL